MRSMDTNMLLVAALSTLAAITTGCIPDADKDGVRNNLDNCKIDANSDQLDVDGDHYGNACDGDFNQDGAVGWADYDVFAACVFTGPGEIGPDDDPACFESDMNGDGSVDEDDFDLFIELWGGPPGPSGTAFPDPTLDPPPFPDPTDDPPTFPTFPDPTAD